MRLRTDTRWLDERPAALRIPGAQNGGGFVCVLDLRRPRRTGEIFSAGQVLAIIVLLALAALAAGDWFAAPAHDTVPSEIPATQSPAPLP